MNYYFTTDSLQQATSGPLGKVWTQKTPIWVLHSDQEEIQQADVTVQK